MRNRYLTIQQDTYREHYSLIIFGTGDRINPAKEFIFGSGISKPDAGCKRNSLSIKMSNIPYQNIDWAVVEKVEHKGETGTAFWQTIQFSGLRIRLVEYSKGYLADHWCEKGHIVYCLEGAFVSQLKNGENFILSKGMSYVVSDGLSSHRSLSKDGVKLLIIDGDFLK